MALFCRRYLDFGLPTKAFVPSDYLNVILLGTLTYQFLLQFNGAYRKHRFVHRFYILNVALKTSAHWLLGLLVITFVFHIQSTISRLFIFWSIVNTLILLLGWRLIFRRFLFKANWAALLRDRVMVVGWSKESDALARQIERNPDYHPYEVVGCVPSARGEFHLNPPERVAILGQPQTLRSLLREYKPDILIFADLDPVKGELVSLAQLCVKENVQFKLIPSFFQIFVSGLHLESVSGVPVIGVSKLPLDHLHNRLLKQAVDLIGASLGLLLSLPLIAFFGTLIYLESPGPIFYTQTRSGRGGRVFKIYKLRSMKVNAESNGPQWTKENDPRRLKIGEFMRRYNIDEIPQFWNILKGEMSLVGPRPERPELIENFKEEITHYNARHCAKPGLSGYAQVNGMRGNTDLKARVRYDLYYLENWSLWLDFQIMLKTFFVRANAY
ncbi:MAG: sugar transferase [Methylacidiphilales bacterium]|nr:sugar transferase [Candidatus Methylacidiphilales bacterium]